MLAVKDRTSTKYCVALQHACTPTKQILQFISAFLHHQILNNPKHNLTDEPVVSMLFSIPFQAFLPQFCHVLSLRSAAFWGFQGRSGWALWKRAGAPPWLWDGIDVLKSHWNPWVFIGESSPNCQMALRLFNSGQWIIAIYPDWLRWWK